MPAKPTASVSSINLILFFEIPPKAIISFLVNLDVSLNLLRPKKFLFFLKSDDTNIFFTFCFSLILISFKWHV